jgi:hypothetical protein
MKIATKRSLLAFALLSLASGVARADLIAYYQFNNPSNLGQDSSGHGNNATNFGATYSAAGYEGGAASFVNNNSNNPQYLQAPVNISPQDQPELTMGAWVNANPNAPGVSYPGIISSDDGDFDRHLGLDSRASPGVLTYSAFIGGNVVTQGLNAIGAGWTFDAIVYDGAHGTATFYSGNNSGTTYSTNFDNSSYPYFDIGRNPGFPEFFSGLIDDVFVYNQTLTSSQIAAIRANGITTPEPSALLLLSGTAVLWGIAVTARLRSQAHRDSRLVIPATSSRG